MKKSYLVPTLCLIGAPTLAQNAPMETPDPQRAVLQQRHAQSLISHLPFKPEVEVLNTPPDPLARVPELREAPSVPVRDLYSDTWVAMDDVGRSVATAAQTRPPQTGKTVGLFYYVNLPGDRGPIQDVSKMLLESPKNPKWGKPNTTYWWGEPDVGYRRSGDFWVLRRDLSMLADAGVDTLMFDTTNATTYWETYMNLCRVARWMHSQGQKTPQISFVTNYKAAQRITAEYNELYAKNLYPEMWFRWQGKPIIFGKKDNPDPDTKLLLPQEIQDFFTWRYSWAWNPGVGNWPWLEKFPQKGSPAPDNPAAIEEVSVATAMHPTSNIGKSYHDGKEPPLDEHDLTPDTGKGLFFAEQWKRALEIDPQFLWITQWNEWASVSPVAGPKGQGFVDRRAEPGQQFLVDTYNSEFNRDIAPMKGGWGDNYYMQMVDGIRRYKGTRPAPVSTELQTIKLDRFSDWNKVAIEYRDSQGDTLHRDWAGHGGNYYKNASGRNDIVTSKVALDAKSISFWVQTVGDLSPATDPQWMQLLINSDTNYATGWKGFDYLVSDYDLKTRTATLKQLKTDGSTISANIRVPFHTRGNQLALSIPRQALGLRDSQPTAFDFHWADNAPVGGDIRDWWLLGDSAPNGRFNYRYQNTSLQK